MKNLQSLSLLLLLLASINVSAQIVTSKKEAQRKGIYSYTEKPVTQPAAHKPAPVVESAVVMTEVAALVTEVPAAPAEKPVRDSRKGGPKKTEAPAKRNSSISDETDPDFAAENVPYLAEQIVNNALGFEGVRYRGGGTTREGMDCSGMVYATFRIFDITLPRNSQAMSSVGTEVELANAKKGDLLFFKNNHSRSAINHVGIVTEITSAGEVKFIHSATHGGVIVSSMSEPYYVRTFVQANRVIEE